jgi:hypothetical protein
MSEMIERVAAAIRGPIFESDDLADHVHVAASLRAARAAIEAMLYPSDDVLLAVQSAAGATPGPIWGAGAEGPWVWANGVAACLGKPLEPSTGRIYDPSPVPDICREWIAEALT